MAGYQFVHIESHALIRSAKAGPHAARPVDEVLAEAVRLPGSCDHVTSPRVPEGAADRFVDLLNELDRRIDEASRLQGRRIRRDRRVLITVICSHPVKTVDIDPDDFNKWSDLSIKWARDWGLRRGLDFHSAILHEDEPYPHLHIYMLPSAENGMRADLCHPGKFAKLQAQAEARTLGFGGKEITRAGNRAYKTAMGAFQDEYYERVGLASGLTRIGPRRKRLSRADWVREKASADKLAQAVRNAATLADREAALARRAQQIDAWLEMSQSLEAGNRALRSLLLAVGGELSPEFREKALLVLSRTGDIAVAAKALVEIEYQRRVDEADRSGFSPY